MFTHQDAAKAVCRPGNYPTSVEQCCIECQRWFTVDPVLVRQAMDAWSSPAPPGQLGTPMRQCVCSHCKKGQIFVMVGKYDYPHARSRRTCTVQFWRWPVVPLKLRQFQVTEDGKAPVTMNYDDFCDGDAPTVKTMQAVKKLVVGGVVKQRARETFAQFRVERVR